MSKRNFKIIFTVGMDRRENQPGWSHNSDQ